MSFISKLRSKFSLPPLNRETIVSFLFFLSSVYFTIYCQKYASSRSISNIPLPDFLHIDSLDLSKLYKLTDIPINVYIVLLLFCFNTRLPKFFWMMGLTYFIRSLSFSMTILPKCGKMIDKDNSRSCLQILKDYVTLKDTHIGHNNDLLPSGHVCFSVIFSLYSGRYGYLSRNKSILLWTVNILNSLMIVLTRCHYSIDVFYAYILSYFVYSNLTI